VATSGATEHGADGVYLVARSGARPVKVVSGLEGPQGLAWYGDTLYVASIGRVDAFGGLRGTRFTQRRKVLSGPVAGASNSGLVVSPNGRLLMGVSAPCDHCDPRSRWSASIVSFRPDGGDLRLYASAVRAAYGLAFRPGTRELFASMNQRDDLSERTPGDWLALVRRGQTWGFPACYGQGGSVCRGVPRPVAVLDKHAAAGQIAFRRGSVVVAEWAAGKVALVTLRSSGSGYSGSVETLVTGLKNPLAVANDHGALLIGDWTTGRIYRITG
jgi:glucose/arabinose dehydrogenase